MPEEIAPIATSLRRITGRPHDRKDVLEALFSALDRRYEAFVREGAPATIAVFRQHIDFLGKRIRVRSNDDHIAGIAETIDDEGALVLRNDRGTHRLWAGDVALI
jgi:BirA family biotin operon repressor/biotin-[acetyl-CoA-carboxylase] ligase